MPIKKSAKISIDLHDDFHQRSNVTIQMNIASIINITNCINFAIRNADKFKNEVNDCEPCFDAVKNISNQLNELALELERHNIKH